MTPLQVRKRLLIAESELNRGLLVRDLTLLKDQVRTVAERAQSWGALAASLAGLIAGAVALQRLKLPGAGGKPGWVRTLLRGAGLISTLWIAIRRPPGRGSEAP